MLNEKGDPIGSPTDIAPETTDPSYDINNKYRSIDKGPFYVYLEHLNKNLGRLFPIKIGYFLQESSEFKHDILDIKSIGLKRVKVEFKSYNVANSLVNHELIRKHKLIAFIPKFYTQKKGIVRMVDTFFEEDYLKNAIISETPVVEVKRMKRKVVNLETKESSLISRQMIIVTFLGNRIPDSIKINLVKFNVEPYFSPVIQCFKCLRYGHTSEQCRSNPRCQKCTKEHTEQEVCDGERFCLHCNSTEHNSISKNCPAYLKQYNIKKTMAYQNMSFKEAETLVNNPSYAKVTTNNRFDLLNNLDNFPELSTSNTSCNNAVWKKPKVNTTQIKNNTQQVKKRKHISPPESPIRTQPETYIQPQPYKTPMPTFIPHPFPRDQFITYQNQIISQISAFIFQMFQKQQAFDENEIRNQLSLILNNKNENNSMECISLSDEEY